MFLAVANYAGVRQPVFYIIAGIAAWRTMLKSGVHPTFAGVAIALTIPARPMLAASELIDKAKSNIKSIQKHKNQVDVLGLLYIRITSTKKSLNTRK